jgi:hypothetical protein
MSAAPATSTPQRRWLIVVLIVVGSLMVVGGLTVRELYRLPERSPATVIALPNSTVRPLGDQPGPDTLELTPDAATHPQHEAVRALLQDYFDAINGRDYDRWRNTVARARAEETTRAKWLAEYRTTKDGSILVYRIDAQPQEGLRVFLAFTSTQDPSSAPPELPEACVHWNLVFPLAFENGQFRVDAVVGFTATELSRC